MCPEWNRWWERKNIFSETKCKCKFDSKTVNSNWKWNRDKCWCECEKPLKRHKYNENCIGNPSICVCEYNYTKLIVNECKWLYKKCCR